MRDTTVAATALVSPSPGHSSRDPPEWDTTVAATTLVSPSPVVADEIRIATCRYHYGD